HMLGLNDIAVVAIVVAMGLENAVFQIDGGGGLGLTYVTGALVKVGQLLAAAGLAHHLGQQAIAVGAIVLAMGLENAVFQIGSGGGLGLTYVTGALVKVGQLLAAAMTGGPRWGWLPNLLLWAAMVAGAVVGALGYNSFNLDAIWFAALVALALAAMVAASAKRPD
ncbi:MAG TPA: DUF1275 family protein, partial [Reyranella sp.]|nr:DUF1275 family protein [Reyranella sp.]